MKALGLDLGNASLGIAISDQHGMLARGVENFRFKADDLVAAKNKVLDILQLESVHVIVLGYPKNMDGTIGKQAQQSEHFKNMLRDNTDIPIVLWDERLTTKMASSMMIDQNLKRKKRKKTLDQSSAVILLQSYLDSKK